jgi:Arc/MetJ-type ribon-helix-helix transcriptional regulator
VTKASAPAPAASTVVAWVRLLPEQAERLGELVFLGNRELEDHARAAGRFRVRAQDRLTESDVIRYAVDQLLEQGGWQEHRAGLRRVVGQTRKPGRPARGNR